MSCEGMGTCWLTKDGPPLSNCEPSGIGGVLGGDVGALVSRVFSLVFMEAICSVMVLRRVTTSGWLVILLPESIWLACSCWDPCKLPW